MNDVATKIAYETRLLEYKQKNLEVSRQQSGIKCTASIFRRSRTYEKIFLRNAINEYRVAARDAGSLAVMRPST